MATVPGQGWGGSLDKGMVEYALILVLVAVVLVVMLLTMGHQIANVFSNVAAAIGCYAGPGGGHC